MKDRWTLSAIWWCIQYAYWGLHYEVKWWLKKKGGSVAASFEANKSTRN